MSEIVFAVLDVNDNAPTFLEAPYKFRIKETVAVGDVVFSKVREREREDVCQVNFAVRRLTTDIG